MSAANRERKIIGTVPCPACGAMVGYACRYDGPRPIVCRERREAWQAWREVRPPDLVAELVPGALHISALTDQARAWLFETPYGVWNGEYLKILPEQLSRFTHDAAEGGYKIGEP